MTAWWSDKKSVIFYQYLNSYRTFSMTKQGFYTPGVLKNTFFTNIYFYFISIRQLF